MSLDSIGPALIGAFGDLLKKQGPPQIGAPPQAGPTPMNAGPARVGATPGTFAGPVTSTPPKVGAGPQPQPAPMTPPASGSGTIGAQPQQHEVPDYAQLYAEHAAQRPSDLDPEAGKPSLLRKIGGVVAGTLIGGLNPAGGAAVGRSIINAPRHSLEMEQQQKMQQWERGGADISKEAALADTVSQIHQRDAEANKANAPAVVKTTPEEDAYRFEVGAGKNPMDAYTAVKGAGVKPVEPKTKTIDEEYDDAVRTGDTARASQLQKEMKTIAGAKREPRAPTDTEGAISDYLGANKLANTPANRLAARQAIKDKPESGASGEFDKANAADASKQVSSAHDADFRYRSMNDSLPKAQKGDQQAMMNLLTNHIGMTLGLQKGARITKDILQEAQKSTPWLQGVEAKFDDRGYLSGLVLTPEQMGQMMDLAKSQRVDAWQRAADSSDQAGVKGKVKFPDDLPQFKAKAPDGASDEVYDKDGTTLIGHVVGGKYVPLKTQ